VDALRAKIHAALEGAESPPTGSGESCADSPETHDINARPPCGRAGSDTATAIAVAVRLERFKGAKLRGELRELRPALPSSESDEHADDAVTAELLYAVADSGCVEPPRTLRTNDGRSRRATSKAWLRAHTPLVYAGLYDDGLVDERRRRAELERDARDRRAALACCIECRNPLLATEYGFQFCPYERAGQHPKVMAALRKAELVVLRGSRRPKVLRRGGEPRGGGRGAQAPSSSGPQTSPCVATPTELSCATVRANQSNTTRSEVSRRNR
jgi:hypothetical protein